MAASIYPTKTMAGIEVIDTPLVRAAQDYARTHCDDMTYNHVIRSWLFGVIILNNLRTAQAISDINLEAFAIAIIFHDLGWAITPSLVSPNRRFEVDGAINAVTWIEQQQTMGNATFDAITVQQVWDAIALHTSPSIALLKEPLVKLCAIGIVCDFAGPDGDQTGSLRNEQFDQIAKEFPRSDLASGVTEKMCGFCRTKPETTYGTFMQDFGKSYVEGYSTEGKLPIDLIQNTVP